MSEADPGLEALGKRAIAQLARTRAGRFVFTVWKYQRTEAFLLSFPKCGRTWIRLMVGKALVDEFGLDSSNPMELGRLHRLDGRIPRILVSHETKSLLAERSRFLRSRSYRGKTVIFLVRDPRDVVVSWYFQYVKRNKLADRASAPIGDFIRAPIGLAAIMDYYNSWAEKADRPKRFCLVRYEDVHRDAAHELRRILSCLELEVSDRSIASAVEYARFENMRKLEAKNALGSNRLRAGQEGDEESFKTRKGKVHGFHEYLEPVDIEFLNQTLATQLSPYFAAYLAPV